MPKSESFPRNGAKAKQGGAMSRILFSIVILFSVNLMANETYFICNHGDAHAVASYDEAGTIYNTQLDDFRAEILKTAFDDRFNCDEGVELLGAVKTDSGAQYLADCSADSLGTATVRIDLVCQDLNSIFK